MKNRKIIVGIENCQNCKMLKAANPDIEYKQLTMEEAMTVGRILGVRSMPFFVEIP